jgi:hypothetical protein
MSMRPVRTAIKKSLLPHPAGAPPLLLQRAALERNPLPVAPPLVRSVVQAPGRPLDAGIRTLMEARFRYDFGQVRIHADGAAAESARAVRARAYTLGSQVVFATGQYAPETAEGRQLIAHELVHVVQQGSVSASGLPRETGAPGNDRHERAAEAAADRFASGASLEAQTGVASAGLQRAEDPGPAPAAQTDQDVCAKQENDPESFSIQAAKHFLTEVDPSASQVATTVKCESTAPETDRMECDVTFADGGKIHVTWIKSLNNVEAQRPTKDDRQWCVYHYVCNPDGSITYEKKGCSPNVGRQPSGSTGPTLVGSAASAGGSRGAA